MVLISHRYPFRDGHSCQLQGIRYKVLPEVQPKKSKSKYFFLVRWPQPSPWISMDIHGYPWTSMEIHGYLWISMDIHGNPWISMDIHGYPWTSMAIHGNPWISMDLHGNPWKSMDIHGYLSISIDIRQYPWISMDIHLLRGIQWTAGALLGGREAADEQKNII